MWSIVSPTPTTWLAKVPGTVFLYICMVVRMYFFKEDFLYCSLITSSLCLVKSRGWSVYTWNMCFPCRSSSCDVNVECPVKCLGTRTICLNVINFQLAIETLKKKKKHSHCSFPTQTNRCFTFRHMYSTSSETHTIRFQNSSLLYHWLLNYDLVLTWTLSRAGEKWLLFLNVKRVRWGALRIDFPWRATGVLLPPPPPLLVPCSATHGPLYVAKWKVLCSYTTSVNVTAI